MSTGTTVKTHVGRWFEKTGTTRQADLVKIVAGYAALWQVDAAGVALPARQKSPRAPWPRLAEARIAGAVDQFARRSDG